MDTAAASPDPIVLRLGTRGSRLARTQSQLVADELEKRHPGVAVELVIFKTSADQIADRPLHEFGGKGLFTREIEQALLDNQVDLAVHSFKDLPVTMPLVDTSGLMIPATTEREDPRDVLIAPEARTIEDLKQGARIGTSSLRRRCQLLSLRPDLIIEPMRGNVDTRLAKLRDGKYDAIVLAYAGLHRTGLFDAEAMGLVPLDQVLPAPGQGALALQCRRDDERTIKLLAPLNDERTAVCVAAERQLVAALEGDCHSPIAALATVEGSEIHLRAVVGGRDGAPPIARGEVTGATEHAAQVVRSVYDELVAQGALSLLRPRD